MMKLKKKKDGINKKNHLDPNSCLVWV
jgi:hypothetical protein